MSKNRREITGEGDPGESTAARQAVWKSRPGHVRVTAMPALPGKEEEFLHDRIARKAYEVYERRGYTHGRDLDDWLRAEELLRAEIQAQSRPKLNRAQKRSRSPEKGDETETNV